MRNLPTTENHFEDTGLNGFFSWVRKALNRVAAVVTVFSPGLGGILNDFSDGDGSFFGFNTGTIGGGGTGNEFTLFRSSVVDQIDLDIEVTPLDEANLDNWLKNNFLPYFNIVLQKLQGFNNSNTSPETFIIYYNEVNLLIAYLLTVMRDDRLNGVDGLSRNGVLARIEFLKVQTHTLKGLLDEYTSNNDLDVFTRKQSLNISTSKYNSLGFNSPETLRVSYKEVALINGTPVDYEEIIEPGTGNVNVVTNPPNNNTNPEASVNETSKIGKTIFKGLIWTAIGYGTSKLLNK